MVAMPTETAHQHGSRLPQNPWFCCQREKVCLQPTQVIEFLGFVVDSIQTKIYLPEKKVKDIVKECRRLWRMRIVSAHALAHLIGKMTATIPAVFPAALHYRALQRLKNRILWKPKTTIWEWVSWTRNREQIFGGGSLSCQYRMGERCSHQW